MFKLKQIPEDFIVDEVPNRNFGKAKGVSETKEVNEKYSIFRLMKRNYNTEDAISIVAEKLGVQRKNISYAGTKDRNAITTQYVSVLGNLRYGFEMKDMLFEFRCNSFEPLSLGDLEGNNFRITIRNLEDDENIKELKSFINYFDSQRFSKNNADIGRLIIMKKYADACKLLAEDDSRETNLLKESLRSNPNNYLGALKTLPRKTLLMYVHAFQSLLWNNAVEEYLGNNLKVLENDEMPLIGFSTQTTAEKEEIISRLLKEENLTKRDFILRDFPELSLEGNSRNIFVEIKNLKISNYENDELNLDKKKVVVEFFLEKGCYATMAIKQMMGESC